jgi:hypothetical protein
MRYQEFNLSEDELLELKMSPGNLQKMAANIDAQVGMEFELIIPNYYDSDDEIESEPDYDYDERFPVGPGWDRDVVAFFTGGDMGNSRSYVQRKIDELNENFWGWLEDEVENYISSDAGNERALEIAADNVSEDDYETTEEYEAALREFLEHNEERIRDELADEYRDDADSHFERYIDEENINSMSDFGNEYGLDWPYWTYNDRDGADVNTVAQDFEDAIGKPVIASSSYHGASRKPGHYVVEPDSSLHGDDGEAGLEFVSPPQSIPEMLADIDKITKWASRVGAYTNDSTGLHMNVSVPNQQNLDYVKLAMFLGDEYILDQFGREGNTYCKSALKRIKQSAKNDPSRVAEMMQQFQSGLNQLASKVLHTGSTDKYTSINNRGGWIEFRGPGGNWLDGPADIKRVKDTLLRAVVALDVATKPEEFKQEYFKKLYKTLAQGSEDDSIQYFAKYAAGELPKQALKSFVRQIQQKRSSAKQTGTSDTDMPFVWKVYGSPTSPYQSQGTEVVATSAEQAKARAVAKWNLNLSGRSVEEFTQAWRAVPQRPASDEEIAASASGNQPTSQLPVRSYWVYVEGDRERGVTVQATGEYAARQIATMERPGIFSSVPFADIRVEVRQAQQTSSRDQEFSGTWEVVSRTTDDVVYRFNAAEAGMSDPRSVSQAEDIADRWRAGASFDDDIYVRPHMRPIQARSGEPVPAGAVAGSTQDLARQRLAAQMPRHEPEDGNWEVYSIASNNTVYRFIANTEEEAVRAFHIWQDAVRAPGLPREGFNLRAVRPMGSSGAEQTASEPGRYRVNYTGTDGRSNSVTIQAANADAAMDRVRRQLDANGYDIRNIEAEPAAGEQPAAASQAPRNQRWRILDRDNQEIYSFMQTTSQSDANASALNYITRIASPETRERGPFEVVPTITR